MCLKRALGMDASVESYSFICLLAAFGAMEEDRGEVLLHINNQERKAAFFALLSPEEKTAMEEFLLPLPPALTLT